MRLVRAALFLAVTGCAAASSAGRPTQPAASALPEPLRITVVYPDTAVPIEAHDSSFLFGNVTRPRGAVTLTLTIDGRPVPVLATGAWLAWVPLPDDTIAAFRLVARAPLTVRAAPGASVRLHMESDATVQFVPDSRPMEPAWGVRAFGTDSATYRLPPAADRYVAWFPAAPLCDGMLEVAIGADTARAPWPLFVDTLDRAHPAVVELNDDTAHTGLTDSLTIGKAVPVRHVQLVLPARHHRRGVRPLERSGAPAAVARRRGVNAADVIPLPRGTPPPGGIVGSVRLSPGPRSLVLRVPLPARLPFQVSEGERSVTLRLYGVVSDINWMQYGGTDPYVTRLSYAQPAGDEVTISAELAGPVWGYRTAWSGRDLLLEIRRSPVIDRRRPSRAARLFSIRGTRLSAPLAPRVCGSRWRHSRSRSKPKRCSSGRARPYC